MKNKIFGYIVLVIAITLAGTAGYYSVIGLSKIFAASETEVIIMASSMEIGKLAVATLLHNYWNDIKGWIKVYLTVSVVILMTITSAGIYGLLSASYQETAYTELAIDRGIDLLESKIENFEGIESELIDQREMINKDIENLRYALSNNIIRYTDKETGKEVVTTSSSNRKTYQKELEIANDQRELYDSRIFNIKDSINNLSVQILESKNSADSNSELLPLKYISKITGFSMDGVVNVFILLLITVFDPLAIALILSANILFTTDNKDVDSEKEKEEVEEPSPEKVTSEKEDNPLDEYIKELNESRNKLEKEKLDKLTPAQIRNMSHQEIKKYLNS